MPSGRCASHNRAASASGAQASPRRAAAGLGMGRIAVSGENDLPLRLSRRRAPCPRELCMRKYSISVHLAEVRRSKAHPLGAVHPRSPLN